MTRKGLSQFPHETLTPEQMFLFEQCASARYIAHGRTVEHEGKEILLLHFFPRRQTGEDAKAVVRVFISRNDYITQDLRCQPAKWKTGALDSVLQWDYVTWGSQWYSGKYHDWQDVTMVADAQTIGAIQCITGSELNPLQALQKHQGKIIAARLAVRHSAIEAKIDAKMDPFPDLPEDFNDWLQQEGFGKHRYLVYVNCPKEKIQKIRCNTCGGIFEHAHPKHDAEFSCPVCGRNAVFKSIKKAQGTLEYGIQSACILPYPGGFCVRYFTTRRDDCKLWEPEGWGAKLREEYREIYAGGECEMFSWGKFLSSQKHRWRENTEQLHMKRVAVYARNLPQVLEGTPWQYCGLKEFATRQDGAEVDVAGYLVKYKKKPYIEYLSKLRLFQLVDDLTNKYYFDSVLNEKAETIAGLLRIPKHLTHMVQEIDPDLDELGVLQKMIADGINVNAKDFRRAFDTYERNAEDLMACAKYANFSRIDSYLEKHRADDADFHHTVHLWIDYVEFCEKLGYDLKNDFVLFPHHLKQSHDDTIKRYNGMKKGDYPGLLNSMTQRIAREMERVQQLYGFAHEGLLVIAPQNLNDIVKEGHVLRHCVGGYVDKVFQGKSTILFLRRADKPQKPYYTIEIGKSEIAQCRGKNNCEQTDEVKKFLAQFEKEILRREIRAA
jgi:predicted RNA-binding Zn-ribbon protein involved in translation (DUF1610 family)